MRPFLRQRAKNSRGEIRLLPAVIGVGAILFALKAAGLAFSAQAAGETPTVPAKTATATSDSTKSNSAKSDSAKPNAAKPADPTAAIAAAMPNVAAKPAAPEAAPDALSPELEGAGASPAQMDVLMSLSDRRDALEDRQRQLDLRANVIAAAEKRVDDKILQLKALQAQIESLLGQRDAKDAAQLDSLVKVYSAMKPKDAARVFASLDDEVRLGVAGRMKADAMAGIMAALPAEVAQKLTVELAGHYKMPAAAAGDAVASSAPAAPSSQSQSPAPAPAAPAGNAPPAPAPKQGG